MRPIDSQPLEHNTMKGRLSWTAKDTLDFLPHTREEQIMESILDFKQKSEAMNWIASTYDGAYAKIFTNGRREYAVELREVYLLGITLQGELRQYDITEREFFDFYRQREKN